MDNLKAFLDTFAAPGTAYRGKPFWAWNGRLDTDELRRQRKPVGQHLSL